MSESPSTVFDSSAFLKTLTSRPGVYRMLDVEGQVIYVGKARDLKKRVSSYFRRQDNSPKTRALVAQINHIEVTVTHTENEALILENNLIKELKPRYNILLRDDKSYPYIYLSEGEFPRLSVYRGKRGKQGRYFGPFPSASAVRDSLNLLQKLFRVRQCEDTFFKNRSRPCLQHQIKRCTAPCVDFIDVADYQQDVRHTVMFLKGQNTAVIDELAARMEQSAAVLDYEQAARYRDQVASLRRVQESQYVSGDGGDLDVIVARLQKGVGCVQVFFIRGGRNLGNKNYFPRNTGQANEEEILAAFITQHYLSTTGIATSNDKDNGTIPAEILINSEIEEREWLEQVLTQQAGYKVKLSHRLRGERARWVDMAVTNADQALTSHLASKSSLLARFECLQDALTLESMPQRLECFDISHTMGEATVASCVVFDTNGALKSDYRRYNIEDITPGDDYAAMHQALSRRFRRLKEGEGKCPDILFIDGGKGQVSQALAVLEELQVVDVFVLGVAKGPSRKAGLEQLILPGQDSPIILPADSPALHLIQQVRDEAHRFAITGHRGRRAKARKGSLLKDIPGLGPKRRQQLLRQFGGLPEVARAGVEDLAKIPGINQALAQRIYDSFHAGEG